MSVKQRGSWMSVGVACAWTVAWPCPAPPITPERPANILFYGNSYTLQNGGVAQVVRAIAEASGRPIPNTVNAAIAGYRIADHVNGNLGPINALPAGSDWDHVVMQDLSTLPTRVGSVILHVEMVGELYDAVAARSPGVTPVLFQTWARRGDNAIAYSGYVPWFPQGPSQMQRDLRNGYLASMQAIDDRTFAGRTRVAWAGDAWEAVDYQNLHISDMSHPQARGTFLAGLSIYCAIYQTAPESVNPSLAAARLSISPAEVPALVAAAQAIYLRPTPEFQTDPPPPPLPGHCAGADFNGDGFVEPGDLDEFITTYFGGAPESIGACDINHDGFVSPDDLDEFITIFFDQC
ncbi:MAG: EF-hand domain-containing protein [Phycisphaerales bacterium]